MTVLNNNPLDLQATPGETITIHIVESATVRQVAKTLNNGPLATDSFRLPAAPDPSLLTISFGFSGNAGAGRDAIPLIGSTPGGDSSFCVVHEPSGAKTDSITYTINVVSAT